MDRILARRLESDPDFNEKIRKLVIDYLVLGQSSVNYWSEEFDAAHDILMCYAPLNKKDLESLEKGHPKRFILPMTTTQINTMTSVIAQTLFGDQQPHKVEGRGPEDEVPAEHMNQLLRWNAEQQPTYLLGYLWIQDILTFNRGVLYNSWAPVYDTKIVEVEVEDPNEIDNETGLPTTYLRAQKKKTVAGGYNKMELVSPYEFYCDPTLPLYRLQEMRFAGHRTTIPWTELKRRSELPLDDPSYVLPSAVEELKTKRKKKSKGSVVPVAKGMASHAQTLSRSAFERTRATGNLVQENANDKDPGVTEIHEFWIRLVPSDADLYDGNEPVIFQCLLGNQEVVLAVNEATYEHDSYPYSIAEGRPNGYLQFSPSYVILLKALQDYVDYLKNRHQEALSRSIGNIFIARTDKVNLADFLNPDKEGLIIPILPEAAGDKLDDIIRQVQVNDVTKEFANEMKDFISFSETVTGANSNMQGQMEPGSTATEFAGTQQMSAGRINSVARLISVQGVVPQTKQFVANFQQFLTQPMALRFKSTAETLPQFQGISSLEITSDIIQGDFDFVAHDGTLPGTDARKVAAMTRMLEAAEGFPQFFEPQPGNIDARAVLLAIVKAAGVNVENFLFTQPKQGPPGGIADGAPSIGPLPTLGELAPNTDLAAPGDGPGRPKLPDVDRLPSASPPQARPQNI